MDQIYLADSAVMTEGRCDLTGLPCLRAINLARQMARAAASLDGALPEDFGLEAEVEVSDCLRTCGLSLAVSETCVAVSHNGYRLASVDLPALVSGSVTKGRSPAAALGWRGH